MDHSIFNRIKNAARVLNGTIDLSEMVPIIGEWDVKVVRADGRIEERTVKNIVTRQGLNRLAYRAASITNNSGHITHIAVGSATATHTLDSTQANLGEVSRKALIVAGIGTQSREWIYGVATWGGAADSVTSIALNAAGLSDWPNSSASVGILFNMVDGLGVTLGNSDFLNLTVRIRVGSHDLSHSI
jgi:hypothetical protein